MIYINLIILAISCLIATMLIEYILIPTIKIKRLSDGKEGKIPKWYTKTREFLIHKSQQQKKYMSKKEM